MSKLICLITPGHLATNPRLVKEAAALLDAGYKVHVIFTQYMEYLLAEDELILINHTKLTYNRLIWTKPHRLRRISSGLQQKVSDKLAQFLPNFKLLKKIILNRNYRWQYKAAVKAKADLYIAHNAGALAIAADAAKKNKAKYAFDAEDFHRGEDLSILVKKQLTLIEDQYLPSANYISAASPLIAKEYENLYQKPVSTILNVFPKSTISVKLNKNIKGLKLFWFSQTIGFDRGLEEVIKAMGKINNQSISLHLLGAHNDPIKNDFKELATSNGLNSSQLYFYQPISPDKIFPFAQQFDIGLATETGIPYNRDICLTNKIFTYVQSGLAVIASDTQAQVNLVNEFPEIGKIYKKMESDSLAKQIEFYLNHFEQLNLNKSECLLLGNEVLNWELERTKILNIINDIV